MDLHLWKVSFEASLDERTLADIEATGAIHVADPGTVAPGSPPGPGVYTFHVPAPDGDGAARLLERVLVRNLVTVKTYAIQSTPVG